MSESPDHLGPSYQLPAPPPPDPTGWIELRRKARAAVWPPQPVAWAALLAAAVAAAGIHGLWFQATLASRLPTQTDWKAAATLIGREARPGDVVALAPSWAERAREVLPERLPSRPDVSLPVLALPSYAEADEDLVGARRVWLLSLPGAPRQGDPISSTLAARSRAVEPPVRLGGITLTRHELRSPLVPLVSFPDRLAAASVEGTAARLGREIREVAGQPHGCIVAAFAGQAGGPVTLRWREVPLGRALRGGVGLVGDPPAGSPPVTVRVLVDGAEVARAEASGARPGWTPFQVDAAPTGGPAREVAIEIAPSGPLPRGVCVDAVTLP